MKEKGNIKEGMKEGRKGKSGSEKRKGSIRCMNQERWCEENKKRKGKREKEM